MNTRDYRNEISRQLQDRSTYKRLPFDNTAMIALEINTKLKEHQWNGNITEDQYLYISPRRPVFYILPKIHKNILPPPGRPAVSGCGSATEKLSRFVDYYLRPLVVRIPSYIQDTQDFLLKLNQLPFQIQGPSWFL